MRRRTAAALAAALVAAGVLAPAGIAEAQSRDGDVTITIPTRIVLNGHSIPVLVSSGALHSGSDQVHLTLSAASSPVASSVVRPNERMGISTTDLSPSSAVVLRVDSITTPCDLFDDDPCTIDDSGDYAEFVTGLTLHPSAAAVAKYEGRVSLRGARSGSTVTWTATATRWNGAAWVPWSGAALVHDGDLRTADADGIGVWTEQSDATASAAVTAAGSASVWGATSRTASVAATVPTAPGGSTVVPPAVAPTASAPSTVTPRAAAPLVAAR